LPLTSRDMTAYGTYEYWDTRYDKNDLEPYDWLFGFKQVRTTGRSFWGGQSGSVEKTVSL
jgi:hypothetical protein